MTGRAPDNGRHADRGRGEATTVGALWARVRRYWVLVLVITWVAAFGGWHVPVWALLVTCAVVSTALAYVLSISSLRLLPANVASVLAVA